MTHLGTMHLFYDAQKRPSQVKYNGTIYNYALNQQGDVVGLTNPSGALVVEYKYDAWGKLLSTTGSMATTLGAHNPLRYRGYCYDEESGLYYLKSRYYNPEIGRFLSPDMMLDCAGLGYGCNLFAYCANNPVNALDSDGVAPWRILRYWGQIHDAVQRDIVSHHTDLHTEVRVVRNIEVISGTKFSLNGRLDIALVVGENTGIAWEIKPKTLLLLGRAQLASYKGSKGGDIVYKPAQGGEKSIGGSFIEIINQYSVRVDYWDEGGGLILYDFRIEDPEPDPAPAPVVEPASKRQAQEDSSTVNAGKAGAVVVIFGAGGFAVGASGAGGLGLPSFGGGGRMYEICR